MWPDQVEWVLYTEYAPTNTYFINWNKDELNWIDLLCTSKLTEYRAECMYPLCSHYLQLILDYGDLWLIILINKLNWIEFRLNIPEFFDFFKT